MPTTPQMSTSQALDMRLSLIMLITVQGTTPKNSSSDVQHCTALMVVPVCSIHSSITAPSFAIFIRASAGTCSVETYLWMCLQLGLRRRRRIPHARNAAQDLRKVDGLDRDSRGFQQLLAVADRVEGRRPRADGADAQILQPAHHAAGGREPVQVLAEDFRIRSFGVARGERIGNAVLREVVARRHLAAEAVAPVGDGHPRRRVGGRLNQHRHVQAGQPQGVRDAALVAEIRQRDDHAVDLVAVLLEEVGAGHRFGARLHRSVLAVLGPQRDRAVAGGAQHFQHLRPAALGEVVGEEPAVSDDHSKRHALRVAHEIISPFAGRI